MYLAARYKPRKTLAAVAIAVFLLVALSLAASATIRSNIKSIFRLNQQLKAEGYYLAEFEFKMLGCAYYLDKGQYVTALQRLFEIRDQFQSKDGLIKVPQFADKREELAFYLGLQNPKTGAFMDDAYPLFTYIGPTSNVIAHIETLCEQLGEPLRLRYPLRFLDDLGTPEKLKVMLDDLATVGFIGSKFRAPYIQATELNGYPEDMTRTGLYSFSPEWNRALLQWFYDNQDPKTGYWGPRLRSTGELLDSGDLLSTEKALKFFWMDGEFHKGFPLRYADRMLLTTLRKLAQPMPQDLGDIHEWTLVMNRGTRLVTRYLWAGLSPQNKSEVRDRIEAIVRIRFERFFVESDGAFSLYPGAAHADLDGTGEMLGYLNEIGALSRYRQESLWGPEAANITDLGTLRVAELTQDNFVAVGASPGVNSLRVYGSVAKPDDYGSGLVCIIYPRKSVVLDVMDLMPRVARWTSATSQSMGNWVSRENVLNAYVAGADLRPVPVSTGGVPLELAAKTLQDTGSIVVIGFDVLQIPRYRLTLYRNP